MDHTARRHFLRVSLSTTGVVLAGCATAHSAARAEHEEEGEEEVTPGEDLMQEHGVLERILLIYDEAARRIERAEAFELSVLRDAAGIVRRFVEDYHEKQEEDFVFPRLETAKREVELVAVLRRQHERGRELTDDIVRRANAAAAPELAALLRSFVAMYRPHAAREETVLLPAFRELLGTGAYRELGDEFEAREHALFGERGFESTVAQVAQLEAALGIADLARFTP
jgi:hemerythrin-like domain-containing protein